MLTPKVKKLAGAMLAAATFALVASVVPASEAESGTSAAQTLAVMKWKDSGWGSV
jgi:hypothetical protein